MIYYTEPLPAHGVDCTKHTRGPMELVTPAARAVAVLGVFRCPELGDGLTPFAYGPEKWFEVWVSGLEFVEYPARGFCGVE